jgi:hypothetical protein
VAKGVDKLDAVAARRERQLRFTAWMRSTGISSAKIGEVTATNMASHYLTDKEQPTVATRDLFEKMRPYFGCDVPTWVEQMVDERTIESENFKRREIIGKKDATLLAVAPGQDNDRSATTLDITAPATPQAAEWEGWGTALKPAFEPIVLARKSLSEKTVAANMLKWGTGALNIDGCRIGAEGGTVYGGKREGANDSTVNAYGNGLNAKTAISVEGLGRWPANVVHDGSDEVVGMFPNTASGKPGIMRKGVNDGACYGAESRPPGTPMTGFGDSGSAARFFYSAKADSDDRLGSKHPTVKPVDLMQWLVRLITPPKGTVLDPFAGTGSTAEAAFYEGASCILIERETGYQADIRRRMALVWAGPDERIRETVKAKNLAVDYGPLFAGSGEPVRDTVEVRETAVDYGPLFEWGKEICG